MTQTIYRSFSEPDRDNSLSWNEHWKGDDNGLITCWEVGRELRQSNPELAQQAENGELPILGWRGGVDPKVKKQEKKSGTLNYLAQWQGLTGQDLNIDLEGGAGMTCTKTNVVVTYSKNG